VLSCDSKTVEKVSLTSIRCNSDTSVACSKNNDCRPRFVACKLCHSSLRMWCASACQGVTRPASASPGLRPWLLSSGGKVRAATCQSACQWSCTACAYLEHQLTLVGLQGHLAAHQPVTNNTAGTRTTPAARACQPRLYCDSVMFHGGVVDLYSAVQHASMLWLSLGAAMRCALLSQGTGVITVTPPWLSAHRV
jgi:hypothetical protein